LLEYGAANGSDVKVNEGRKEVKVKEFRGRENGDRGVFTLWRWRKGGRKGKCSDDMKDK
jgi:hypothetical protein